MTSSVAGVRALARDVQVTESELIVDLADGRRVSVPLTWFPRLLLAAPAERGRWELLGDGQGIHWPEVDEDLSVAGLLAGTPSVSQPGDPEEKKG
jgi:hypothetical protein